jgi:putative ABC transport system permease protein
MHRLLPLEFALRDLQSRMGFRITTPLVLGTALAAALILLGVFWLILGQVLPGYTAFIARSLRRNILRTTLACLAIVVLVFVITLVWSFLVPLDIAMTERSKNFKMIITERLQVPSRMPRAYEDPLSREVKDEDSMTWSFYGGSLDPENRTFENIIFFYVMEPRKLTTMMDELEDLDPALVKKMEQTRNGCIIGRDRLKRMNRRIGDHITVTSFNYKDIDLEFEIVGTFPDNARYNQAAVMNREYLYEGLEQYKKDFKKNPSGKAHPAADKPLALVWLRMPDSDTFSKVGNRIMSSPEYSDPYVKAETAASGISTWLEPYKDILNGVKWGLVPALLCVMCLVMAMAISINVRERRTEMAVLKVLGYTPNRIMAIVLGEALLIGAGAGLLSAALSFGLIHGLMGGIPFQIAFFPVFDIFADALWWGPVLGAVTTFAGSIIPAWTARNVKVSEVFAKIA